MGIINSARNNLFGGRKRMALTALLTAATLYGTYSANGGGFPPFSVHKNQNSAGICMAPRVEISEGSTFYGIVLSGYNVNNGKVIGLNLNLAGGHGAKGEMRGLEFSVIGNLEDNKINLDSTLFDDMTPKHNYTVNGVNVGLMVARAGTVNGVQSALFDNTARTLNGIQPSLISSKAEQGTYGQIGIECKQGDAAHRTHSFVIGGDLPDLLK
ncbi:MAG: hypothetical protein ABIA93_06115 [Candidatus Woesearchaeota archaeon]